VREPMTRGVTMKGKSLCLTGGIVLTEPIK